MGLVGDGDENQAVGHCVQVRGVEDNGVDKPRTRGHLHPKLDPHLPPTRHRKASRVENMLLSSRRKIHDQSKTGVRTHAGDTAFKLSGVVAKFGSGIDRKSSTCEKYTTMTSIGMRKSSGPGACTYAVKLSHQIICGRQCVGLAEIFARVQHPDLICSPPDSRSATC
eukprot:974456-Rhodomonas_salina.2